MAKRKSVAARVMSGLEQARDHAAGKDVDDLIEHIPDEIDVAAIRRKTKLSQTEFAKMIAVKLPTLRNWEQGRRRPDGPARVLLSMVDRKPQIVVSTLAARAPAKKAAKRHSSKKVA